MNQEMTVEKVSPNAIFFVDCRHFELGLQVYDERIANSLLSYGVYQEVEESEDTIYEEESLTEAKP